jgi:hypothetical protein
MESPYAGEAHMVVGALNGKIELWAAAVPRERAIEAVQDIAPLGSRLTLTYLRFPPAQVAALKLRPNGVRKL